VTVFRRSLAATALLMTAFAVSAPPATHAGQPVTIRIGYPGVGLDDRPFGYDDYLAIAHVGQYVQAAFKNDPDIKVTWTFFRGAGPALNESLAAGHLDFAAGLGDLPSIVGKSHGLDTEYLAAGGIHGPLYLAVPPNSTIKSIDDLRGKRVAQFRGTNLQMATDRVLQVHGLTERDVRFIGLDTNSATAALVSGAVDASFGASEYLDLARRGVVKIVYSTKGDDPTLGAEAGLLVTRSFEQAHPDLTEKVVQAFVLAAQFGSDEANREKVFAIWAKSGLPVQSFEDDFKDERLAHRLSPVIDPYLVARYKDQVAHAKAYHLITQDVDVDSWFQPKYLQQALVALKLEHYWPTYDAKGKKLTDGTVEQTKLAGN
jgi:sulfonate transport system substrate-binding protein